MRLPIKALIISRVKLRLMKVDVTQSEPCNYFYRVNLSCDFV